MANTTSSAKVGKPPNNIKDYYIIRGIYRQYGITNVDPNLGFNFGTPEPINDPKADHESRQAGIIAGMIIVILAIVVPTIARIMVKTQGNQLKFGWDDFFIVVASILAVVYPILQIIVVVAAGGGLHTWVVTYEDYQFYAYYLTICRLLFYPTVGVIKVSITLFIRRLVETAYRTWRIVADVFLFTVVAYILVAIFWSVFLCDPARASWDMEFGGSLAEPAKCGNAFLNAKVLSIIHVVQSILLLATPIIILWSVRIDRTKKIRLFVIWMAGGVTVTGGLLQQIQPVRSTDIFWDYTIILRWAVLDLAMGIVTASLPVLDAAIMGSWRSATSSFGNSNPNRQDISNHSGRQQSLEPGAPKVYASSSDNIISKDTGVEMDLVHHNRTGESRESSEADMIEGQGKKQGVNAIL